MLRGFGVAFGDQVVLAEVDLHVPAPGLTVLMGPMRGGKSALLRTLAGLNDAQPCLRTWGDATFGGRPLGPENRPVLVVQHAALLASTVHENLVSGLPGRARLTPGEQRRAITAALDDRGLSDLRHWLDDRASTIPKVAQRLVAIVRAVLAEPTMLCVDEPTAGMNDEDASRVLDLLSFERERRGVLVVTHHQARARRLGGRCALLAGGRIQTHVDTETFFAAPPDELTRHFVRTGGTSLPSPTARPEELADDAAPPPPLPAGATDTAGYLGPRDFHWLLRGQLGGMPRPGIVQDLEHDLEALERLGVTLLITLEEQLPFDRAELQRRGIEHVWFPIVDMHAPPLDAAYDHCRVTAEALKAGEVVVLHCRAGHGRTGTMLAAQLVHDGASAVEALRTVRDVNSRWVQSETQVRFLESFDLHVRNTADRHTETIPILERSRCP